MKMVNMCENKIIRNFTAAILYDSPKTNKSNLLKNGKDHSDNLFILCHKHHRAIREGVLNLDFNEKFISNNYNNKNSIIKLD